MLEAPQATAECLAALPADHVSFICPCIPDVDDFAATLQAYLSAMRQLPVHCQLVLVNSELSKEALKQLLDQVDPQGASISIVTVRRTTGESEALLAGFRQAVGDIVVLLPPYIQCDPQDIGPMLDAVNNGLDYAASRREPRIDGKREQNRSRVFNWLARSFSGIDLHDINSGLRVMRREVLEQVPLYGDQHIFLPVLAAQQGFRVGEIPVRHLEERPGRRDQGMSIYLRRALDLLTLFFLVRFTQKPFRFFGGIGITLLATGTIIMVLLGIDRIMGQRLSDRPLLVLSTLMIVLGIQTFSLGLLGELIIFVNAGGLKEFLLNDVHEISTDPVDHHAEADPIP